MSKNAIFILSGNCRTFIDCFDTLYTHIISKLFSTDFKLYMFLYLKLTDPGPKGKKDWNFEYKDIEYDIILDKINTIKRNYSPLNIEYKLLSSNEISDDDLMLQVKNRSLYNNYYSKDNILLRGLHCHYNFEKCGEYILEKEKQLNILFDHIVYVRPDLFFLSPCNLIETYNKSLITLGTGPNDYNNDHIAIIPREHFSSFFFYRMNVYRYNSINEFGSPEEVYWHTIDYEVKNIGKYYIKRT